MANSGGGKIIFGIDEIKCPGISEETVEALDSAILSDLIEKYTERGLIHIHHEIESLENGNFKVTIHIEEVPIPVVIEKDGAWIDSGSTKYLFKKGDVLIRHSSKTEKISQEDMRVFITNAYDRGIEKVSSAVIAIRTAGPDDVGEYLTSTIGVIREAKDLLELQSSRKKTGLPYLLNGEELLWVFIRRQSLDPDLEDLEILIESALRRPVTLFWWLMDSRIDSALIHEILFRIPEMKDRDKSDASRCAIEVGSIFLSSEEMQELIEILNQSDYKHFRDAASSFQGQDETKDAFMDRISNRRNPLDELLSEQTEEYLESYATDLAEELFKGAGTSISRNLADVTRILWAKHHNWL